MSERTFWEDVNEDKWMLFVLSTIFLVWYLIAKIVHFAIRFNSIDFRFLDFYERIIFTPYMLAFGIITVSLMIAKTTKEYRQLERILAILFWIIHLVFAGLNKDKVFMLYVRNNEETSNILTNLIVIEIFFLLALVFTGLTYRTELRGYISYSFYALGAVSFLFFLIRISVEWIEYLKTFILMIEFWLEIILLVILSVLFVLKWFEPKLGQKQKLSEEIAEI
ncbi:MAG: hypothetical protein ACTSQF_13840, partial [Candidatus Heimdallarchaeaceae archaeon]